MSKIESQSPATPSHDREAEFLESLNGYIVEYRAEARRRGRSASTRRWPLADWFGQFQPPWFVALRSR